MRESKVQEVLSRFSKEQVQEIYYTHGVKECSKILQVAENNLQKLIDALGIPRRRRKRATTEELAARISEEELVRYYIDENHTSQETQQHFNITEANIGELFKFYGIENKISRVKALTKAAVIDKDDLYEYYVEENHDRESTIKHFRLKNLFQLDYWLKLYGISKKISNSSKYVSKEELEKYYVDEDHGFMDTCRYFNIGSNSLIKLCDKFDLNKNKDKEYFQEIVDRIDREEFENYFKYHTKEETATHFNVTTGDRVFYGICDYFGINKSEAIEKDITEASKNISKEELESYYIYKNHTIDECLAYFHINKKIFAGLIYLYNINKYSRAERQYIASKNAQRISKEQLEECINSGLSPDEIATNVQLGRNSVADLLLYYDLTDGIKYAKENELITSVKNLGIEDISTHNRKILGNGQEIDVYLPNTRIGIEFNGNYWHSNLKLPKNYHLDKSKLAESASVRLIHVWEYEWDDPKTRKKIMALIETAALSSPRKIYARKCKVEKLTNGEAQPFNEANHLQGHRNAQVTYGLFYAGELVQLMSFSKTKYNKNLREENSWEIIRECTSLHTSVVGGVSKLFRHFIADYNPDSVFSYCDFNKFSGKSYEMLGMKFIGYTGPDMHWVLSFSDRSGIVGRHPSKHKEMKERAVAQLWGAGSKKYLWTKSS